MPTNNNNNNNKLYEHVTLKHAHTREGGALHTLPGKCLYDQD